MFFISDRVFLFHECFRTCVRSEAAAWMHPRLCTKIVPQYDHLDISCKRCAYEDMPLSPEKELQRRVSKILLEAPSAGIRLRRPVGFLSPGYPQQLLHSRGSHTAQDSAEKGRPVFFVSSASNRAWVSLSQLSQNICRVLRYRRLRYTFFFSLRLLAS